MPTQRFKDTHDHPRDVIAMTAVCMIVLIVISHGINAHPLVKALGAGIWKDAARLRSAFLRVA